MAIENQVTFAEVGNPKRVTQLTENTDAAGAYFLTEKVGEAAAKKTSYATVESAVKSKVQGEYLQALSATPASDKAMSEKLAVGELKKRDDKIVQLEQGESPIYSEIGFLKKNIEYQLEAGSIGDNGEDVSLDGYFRTGYIPISPAERLYVVSSIRVNYGLACYGDTFIGFAKIIDDCYYIPIEGTTKVRRVMKTPNYDQSGAYMYTLLEQNKGVIKSINTINFEHDSYIEASIDVVDLEKLSLAFVNGGVNQDGTLNDDPRSLRTEKIKAFGGVRIFSSNITRRAACYCGDTFIGFYLYDSIPVYTTDVVCLYDESLTIYRTCKGVISKADNIKPVHKHEGDVIIDGDKFIGNVTTRVFYNYSSFCSGLLDSITINGTKGSVFDLFCFNAELGGSSIAQVTLENEGYNVIRINKYCRGYIGVHISKGGIYCVKSSKVIGFSHALGNGTVEITNDNMLDYRLHTLCDLQKTQIQNNRSPLDSLSKATNYSYYNNEEWRYVSGVNIESEENSIYYIVKFNTTTKKEQIITASYGGIVPLDMELKDGEYIGIKLLIGALKFNSNRSEVGYFSYGLATPNISNFDGRIGYSIIGTPSNSCGIYMYPFKWVKNQPLMIFKSQLYSLDSQRNTLYKAIASNLKNPECSARSFMISTSSNSTISIGAYDNVLNCVAQKTVDITVRDMPMLKLASSNIKVLFIGDSLLHFNKCKIGEEWYRVIATSDKGNTVNNVIYPTAFNLCPEKIQMVGESIGNNSNIKYQVANKLSLMMQGKRPDTTGPTDTYQNPFYNPNSSNPDELDEEGFNKRVDFDWYFQKICGQGSKPDLIYLTTGPNDLVEYGWQLGCEVLIAEKLKKVLRRIKASTDRLGGGTLVKILNHQFYPLYKASSHGFDAITQRQIYLRMYDLYYAITKEAEFIEWVELIDCASKFDNDYGYWVDNNNINTRSTIKEEVVRESVHMNDMGACQYADCIINDFICDTRFD